MRGMSVEVNDSKTSLSRVEVTCAENQIPWKGKYNPFLTQRTPIQFLLKWRGIEARVKRFPLCAEIFEINAVFRMAIDLQMRPALANKITRGKKGFPCP